LDRNNTSPNQVNLFIIGVNKAGSSWLHYLLDTHPDVYMSKVKEHNYFGKTYPDNRDEYHKYFPFDKEFRYYGESTPTYFSSREIAEEIKEYCPNAKVLAIVRDPIQRLLSHYYFRKQIGVIPEKADLDEGLEIDPHLLIDSHYEKTLPVYQEIFGVDNFKVVSLEGGKQDIDALWKEMCEFLGLTLTDLPDSKLKAENPTGSKAFRGFYRAAVLPIKLKAPGLYKLILQNKLFYWIKTISLAILGTANKQDIPNELMLQLKREFEPTYNYLDSIGFANTYRRNQVNN